MISSFKADVLVRISRISTELPDMATETHRPSPPHGPHSNGVGAPVANGVGHGTSSGAGPGAGLITAPHDETKAVPHAVATGPLESFVYDDAIVRKFLTATIIWGIVGM